MMITSKDEVRRSYQLCVQSADRDIGSNPNRFWIFVNDNVAVNAA